MYGEERVFIIIHIIWRYCFVRICGDENDNYNMIDILLSTYNGEKYVEELLESLNNQTYKDFNVIVRDDGSTDRTLDIIKKYRDTNSLPIHILNDSLGNLGSTLSFETLMRNSKADYFMFCDQDDYWCEQKIEISLKRMYELESSSGESSLYCIYGFIRGR